jgi:hypothetical protein
MRRRFPVVRLAAALLLALAAGSTRAAGQPPSAGEIVNGRVTVVLYATLSEDPPLYFPVAQHTLVFYHASGDSTVRRTDDAGAVTTYLLPGAYRLTSRAPYAWRGRLWSWSMPVVVRPGMKLVELTAFNATRTTPPVTMAARGEIADTRPADARGRKNEGTGVLLSLLLPGGGQMYAGRVGRGLTLLTTATASVVGGKLAGDDAYDQCTARRCFHTGLIAGAVVAGIVSGYSMVTAPGDVREWNRARGLALDARLRPHLAQGDAGTELGLHLRW